MEIRKIHLPNHQSGLILAVTSRPQTRSFAAEEPGGLYGTSLYKVLPGDPMQPTKNWSALGPSTIHLSGGFNHFELGNIQLGYPVAQFLFYILLNHHKPSILEA
jgi:hypothetical protein